MSGSATRDEVLGGTARRTSTSGSMNCSSWTLHFTARHAFWLNPIERWFSILRRQLLTRGSFTLQDDLVAKIDADVAWYLRNDRPIEGSYRLEHVPSRGLNPVQLLPGAYGREERRIELDRLGHRREGVLTFAATAGVREVARRDSVVLSTTRARPDQAGIVGHCFTLSRFTLSRTRTVSTAQGAMRTTFSVTEPSTR